MSHSENKVNQFTTNRSTMRSSQMRSSSPNGPGGDVEPGESKIVAGDGDKKKKKVKIIGCSLILVLIIAGVIIGVVVGKSDGGDKPQPTPTPPVEKGYNPYDVDELSVITNLGSIEGALDFSPERDQAFRRLF